MKAQRTPTEATTKRLFALSRNRCAFPKCTTPIVQLSGTVTGEICHIKARNPGGPRYDATQSDEQRHAFDNLVLFCSVHHKIVDDQPARFTVELLKDMKEMHERDGSIELTQTDAHLARRLLDSYLHIVASGEAQVMVASPGGIQARNLTIKTSRKNLPIPLPADAIGASIAMRSYAEYLVKRYVDWRLKGVVSGKDGRRFHPSMAHQLVERKFGARTYLVPQDRFHDLARFLQEAIDETIEGRIKRSHGVRNYHSFEEHQAQLRGEA